MKEEGVRTTFLPPFLYSSQRDRPNGSWAVKCATTSCFPRCLSRAQQNHPGPFILRHFLRLYINYDIEISKVKRQPIMRHGLSFLRLMMEPTGCWPAVSTATQLPSASAHSYGVTPAVDVHTPSPNKSICSHCLIFISSFRAGYITVWPICLSSWTYICFNTTVLKP